MTAVQFVECELIENGWKPLGDIRIIRGPKRKSDILECWSVTVRNTKVKMRDKVISSAHTLTELKRCGMTLRDNTPDTCLYGDMVAVPSFTAKGAAN